MSIVTATDSDYLYRIDGIQHFVNPSYTEDDLPTSVIENDVYLPSANRYVLRRLPNYESLTDAEKLDAKVLVQKLTAAEILKSLLEETRESTEQRSVDYEGLSMEKRISQFLSDVEVGIGTLAPAETPSESGESDIISTVSIKGTFE